MPRRFDATPMQSHSDGSAPPKYSPTTAPIIASTVATLSPVKMNGRAVGIVYGLAIPGSFRAPCPASSTAATN